MYFQAIMFKIIVDNFGFKVFAVYFLFRSLDEYDP